MRTRVRSTSRLRLMSRGEAITSTKDILKVKDLCLENPNTLFMLPTRAWRSKKLLLQMLTVFPELPNLRLLFSTDPDCLKTAYKLAEEYQFGKHGIKLTYFGDDTMWEKGHRLVVKCQKTWHKKTDPDHRNCGQCAVGCFSSFQDSELHVIHFKYHR